MTSESAKIIWTGIDEAPALATFSLLPIVNAFTKAAGVVVETRDISVAGRIIAAFPECLTEGQRGPDELAYLGALTQKPEANIIKLPNISASIPQLKAAIKELQAQGYRLPDYPEEPKTDAEKEIQAQLRQGAGQRGEPGAARRQLRPAGGRVGEAVRAQAPAQDGRLEPGMQVPRGAHGRRATSSAAKSRSPSRRPTTARIEFVGSNGEVQVLKEKLPLQAGEVLDGSFMSVRALRRFIEEQLEDAKASGLLFSVHLKATMMKISDPVIFGHFVSVFFQDVFGKHSGALKELGVKADLGLGDLYAKLKHLPDAQRAEVEADIKAGVRRRARPWPWSTPPRASPTCTPATTSSSTPPCRW